MSNNRPRAPLASIPNAANSPHCALVQSTKRPRAQAGISQQENEPPQKRRMFDRDSTDSVTTTPRRKIPPSTAEGRVFERGHNAQPKTAFEKKLVAIKAQGSGSQGLKHVEPAPNGHSADTMRQWQKHYRKSFPNFSFYFESIPEELRVKFSRQIASLGAQEERFFSREVTHIVTTRPIPPESAETSSSESTTLPTSTSNGDSQPKTINPILLEKNATTLDRSRGSAPQQQAQHNRRDGAAAMDVLTRGREMDMKIWNTDKFQKILACIADEHVSHGHSTRGLNVAATNTRGREEDLSQVLRKERLHGGTDRDASTLTKDLVPFKGPFIYIHDMEGKTRPTMVREYPKVARRQDGAWPQFRSATVGKCPFVEEPVSKKDLEKERERGMQLNEQKRREALQPPRTRSVTGVEIVTMDPPRRTSPRRVLREVGNVPAALSIQIHGPMSKPFMPPKVDRQSSFPPPMDIDLSAGFARPQQMHFAGEPAASGIQRSNLTSAIRSQMISSTAAMPGAKAATSKEVHELKRKVLLERSNTGSLSVGSIPSSHRMTDIAGVLKNARAPAPQRAAKSKAQEKLGGIQEENPSDDDLAAERAAHTQSRKRKVAKKDPKPGYCENCRDKYDDFDEHVVSRKHRKFAMTASNWTELDDLLRKLQEPEGRSSDR